jgi:hypothetical protein
MLCPVSATQSAAALLHHLGRSIDRASRSRHSKFKPAVLGEIQAAGDNGGTCIDDVARRAGLSTKTMHRLIPNKADLRSVQSCWGGGQCPVERKSSREPSSALSCF